MQKKYMSDLRLLVTTYPTAFLNRGGGEIELIEIVRALRTQGVWADSYGPGSLPLNQYDSVLHFSVVPDGKTIFFEAKANGKLMILAPSLWLRNTPAPAEKQSMMEFIAAADVLLLKSRAEYENLSQYLDIEDKKVIYCKWGVDPLFEEPADHDLFRRAYNLERYILSVGIIEETKNQLNVIRALREFDIPVVFLGDYRDRQYYEACVKLAPQNFRFLPFVQPKSEMLRSAFEGCSLYVECGLEPAGLSAIEAAHARVPMVLSEGPWTDEHFPGLITTADPLSVDSISTAAKSALSKDVDPEIFKRARNYQLPYALESLVTFLKQQ
jgi:glycosyltransferase involved in cell wall biosynthesis